MKTQNANSGRNLNIWKVLCCKTNRQKGPIKDFRIIEFMLCVICLVLILPKHLTFAVHLEAYIAIIGAIVFYIIVAFVDIMLICTWWPTGWLILSITGALFFFGCFGLSFYIDDALTYTVLFAITAFVFLLDGVCTLKQVRNVIPSSRYMKTPDRYPEEQTLRSPHSFEHIMAAQHSRLSNGHYEYERKDLHSSTRPATSSDEIQYSHSSTKRETSSGKEASSEGRRLKKIRNRRSEMTLDRPKASRYAKNLQSRRSVRRMQAKKETFKKVASSYGGTFHMSRDIAPMACPFVNMQEMSQNENYEEQDSKNDWSKYNKMVQSAMLRNIDGVNLTPLRTPHSAIKYRSSPKQNQNDYRSTSAIN